jgi:peptidoglycan/xylan/chitin deacetylase (PgdA/CDA1 family)
MSERADYSRSERDLIGYGPHPPRVRWPGGAKLAINLVVNYEEGSELEWALDGCSEARGEVDYPFPSDTRNLAVESMFEYGSRAGIWRLLRIFDDYGIPATLFACALAFERNPAVADAVRVGRHDVCGHGWRWTEPWALTPEQERDEIHRAVTSFQATCGKRPLGWYWRYGPTPATRQILVEEGGFTYDSDAYNDDLPYYTHVGSRMHLVLPYSATYNDAQGDRSPRTFLEYCRRGIDEYWREGGAGWPKFMSIGMHPRRMGQAARASALREVIEYAQAKGDIWFATRSEVAQWWREQYPPGTTVPFSS